MNSPVRPLSIVLMIDHTTIGGAQRLLVTQARAMRDSPHTLRLIYLHDAGPIAEELRELGVEVVRADMGRLRDGRVASKVASLLRQWQPDVLHVHLIDSILLGGFLARRLGIPLVVTLHNEQPDGRGLSARVKDVLEWLVLSRRTRQIIACGPRVAASQRGRIGCTPMTTVVNRVPRPVPLSAGGRTAIRASFGCGPGDCLFVAIGRLAPQKGFDLLIDAFATIHPFRPNARLLIVGEGVNQTALDAQLRDADLGSAARLLPARPDVGDILSAADVFVLPSRWEGLPLILLEAMAAGRPIVATSVGDIPTVVDEAGAIVVPPEDVGALAGAMAAVADDPERRSQMGAASRRRSAPYVDEAGFARELEAVYLKAVSGRPGAAATRRDPGRTVSNI